MNIDSFKIIFEEKTGEKLTDQTLRKLELVKELQGLKYPTNALILFSDDPLRNSMFHYAKVECVRFKGVNSEVFIDQKSIILRHINQGATVEGGILFNDGNIPLKLFGR